ncbi:hypothetical protein IVB44_22405 [Bradyrhizobium sp. 49]|uniref:hypothetical protein n=1 Tax=unclassified Bradyrhizobium TaxID=2631580 RepID=UPI001FF7D106|nr:MULTISPECIES: hypothetical protein [unclassified Bradyrhizobium]MCK1266794.1 hypothetical protein [Bradyrhizobium sp. 84]MCK1373721.1 hypothetical protein [Bradyrhizobium sp. 49]
MTNSDRQIAQWVEETPFVDTHEHLIEESQRLSGVLDPGLLPSDDWTCLFSTYVRIPTKSPRRTDMKSPVDSETMSPTFPI